MTFSSFLLLLGVVYVLYYTVVILLDNTPFKKTLSVEKIDFVVAEPTVAEPIKVRENFELYMPVIDHDEEDQELTSSNNQPQNAHDEQTESLQAALRMETWSEEGPDLELTAVELCFALA